MLYIIIILVLLIITLFYLIGKLAKEKEEILENKVKNDLENAKEIKRLNKVIEDIETAISYKELSLLKAKRVKNELPIITLVNDTVAEYRLFRAGEQGFRDSFKKLAELLKMKGIFGKDFGSSQVVDAVEKLQKRLNVALVMKSKYRKKLIENGLLRPKKK